MATGTASGRTPQCSRYLGFMDGGAKKLMVLSESGEQRRYSSRANARPYVTMTGMLQSVCASGKTVQKRAGAAARLKLPRGAVPFRGDQRVSPPACHHPLPAPPPPRALPQTLVCAPLLNFRPTHPSLMHAGTLRRSWHAKLHSRTLRTQRGRPSLRCPLVLGADIERVGQPLVWGLQ